MITQNASLQQSPEIVGEAPAFQALLEALDAHLLSSGPVLLVGEPGTGKRLLGHGMHALSPADGPLFSLECAELPEAILARELLGGSGRDGLLDRACGGSLLLLHIDGLGRPLERRLLRRYQRADEGELPRLLATMKGPTPVDGRPPAVGGTLQSLFQERVFAVPPLRHRLDDLDALVDHFLGRYAPEGAPASLSPAARFALQTHRWPGNVRELAGVLQQAAELGGEIGPEGLAIQIRGPAMRSVNPGDPGKSSALAGRSLQDIEAEAVRAALASTGGNRSAAARMLGISRPTLLRKIKNYSIDL